MEIDLPWASLVANQVPKWPFGSPCVLEGRTTGNRCPDRRASRPVDAALPTMAGHDTEISRRCAQNPGSRRKITACLLAFSPLWSDMAWG